MAQDKVQDKVQNKVQYQRGLSMPEFFDRYGSPERCEGIARALVDCSDLVAGLFADDEVQRIGPRTTVGRHTDPSCSTTRMRASP